MKTFLKDNQLFTLLALFFIGLGWLGLLMTLFSFFHLSIILIYIFATLLFLTYSIHNKKVNLKLSSDILTVFLIGLFFVLLFSVNTAPTIFSGRDQGSLSEAAIRLVENHRLEFSTPASEEFFKIYGPGKALNFPGFSYTEEGKIITQFPLGYISWLAIFYSLFGLSGFFVANGITFIFFLLSFYLLSKEFFKNKSSSWIAVIFIATSFVFAWFLKFTLSENLALMLTWSGILQFVFFLKDKNRAHLGASLSALGLLAFARIEALAFIFMLFLILFWKNKTEWKKKFFETIGKNILVLTAGGIALYILNIFINWQFFKTLGKATLSPLLENHRGPEPIESFLANFYTLEVFLIYALLNFLLIGILGIFLLWKQKRFNFLVPFFIVLPSFIYLIDSNISSDYPWMLRRFLFSIIPVCILYTTWLLSHFLKKKIFYIISGIFILTNFLVFIPNAKVSPNFGLLKQVEKMSNYFGKSDLILIDMDASGDNWSMITGPLNFLYGKQAVYFFNPDDFSKLDKNKFEKIYLIVPEKNLFLYKKDEFLKQFAIQGKFVINNYALNIPKQPRRASINYPKLKKIDVINNVYLLKK